MSEAVATQQGLVGKYHSYPDYKDSGMEWLGVIPTNWEALRIDSITEYIRESKSPAWLENKLVAHYSIPSIQEFGVGQIEDGTELDSNKLLVKQGDLLISKLNPRKGTICIVRQHEDPIVASTEFVALRTSRVDSIYFEYLFKSQELSCYICSQVESATRSHQRVNPAVIYKMSLPYPSMPEREKINAFLDYETARIDWLIAKQQQLIELLKEKRLAVISHAVTKGLNPDVPMKDSGVKWLGQVPKHWVVTALKRHWMVVDCKHITAEFFDDGIPLASIREVQSWEVDLSNAKKTSKVYYRALIEGGRLPEDGDIIYSRNATVGEAARVTTKHPPFAMGQDVCLLKKVTPSTDTDFFMYQLKSRVVSYQLDTLMVGSTFKRINVDDIRNFVVVMPPQEEAITIRRYLNGIDVKHQQLEQKALEQVQFLQERRTALISAAVTGKIDLRSWTLPLGEVAA